MGDWILFIIGIITGGISAWFIAQARYRNTICSLLQKQEVELAAAETRVDEFRRRVASGRESADKRIAEIRKDLEKERETGQKLRNRIDELERINTQETEPIERTTLPTTEEASSTASSDSKSSTEPPSHNQIAKEAQTEESVITPEDDQERIGVQSEQDSNETNTRQRERQINKPRSPRRSSSRRIIEPLKRGGRSRVSRLSEDTAEKRKPSRRQMHPTVVCRKTGWIWTIGLEISEDYSGLAEVSVFQGKEKLEPDTSMPNRWALRDVKGHIKVQTAQDDTVDIVLGGEDWLLFKLSGRDMEEGRWVRMPETGVYLIVVPETWRRDEDISGAPVPHPEHVSLQGYRAHFFILDSNQETIAMDIPGGRPLRFDRHSELFSLTGKRIQDSSGHRSDLFGGSLPCIHASDEEIWDDVSTIVVGEEGKDQKRWRTEFAPVAGREDQAFPNDLRDRAGSWYFARIYDLNDDLLDSLDFRFARGLESIDYAQPPPLPGNAGHQPISVEIRHQSDCTIRPKEDIGGTVRIEQKENVMRLTIPADFRYDETTWICASPGQDPVEITLIVQRVWWALSPEGQVPDTWQDGSLELSRDYFRPLSDQSLWIRLPKPGWIESIHIGFTSATMRRFPIPALERMIAVPLRDFGDASQLKHPGIHSLHLSVDLQAGAQETVIARLINAVGCKECDFTAASEKELMKHIVSEHLDYYLPHLSYEEMRRMMPHLPEKIYSCPYCGAYVPSSNDPAKNPTDRLIRHITIKCLKVDRSKGPPQIQIKVISEIEEIRQNVFTNLERIHKCTICKEQFRDPSQRELITHLRKHCQSLISLR